MSLAVLIMIIMREMTKLKVYIVDYLLTDKQSERLHRIAERYKELNYPVTTEENLFMVMMMDNEKEEIDKQLRLHELKLGIEVRK